MKKILVMVIICSIALCGCGGKDEVQSDNGSSDALFEEILDDLVAADEVTESPITAESFYDYYVENEDTLRKGDYGMLAAINANLEYPISVSSMESKGYEFKNGGDEIIPGSLSTVMYDKEAAHTYEGGYFCIYTNKLDSYGDRGCFIFTSASNYDIPDDVNITAGEAIDMGAYNVSLFDIDSEFENALVDNNDAGELKTLCEQYGYPNEINCYTDDYIDDTLESRLRLIAKVNSTLHN